MLEPNYLQNVGDDLEKLYQELATEILVDIAERIKMNQDAMTSTAEYLNNKLKQLGLQQDWINKRLAEILHTSEKEVDRIMQQSAYKSIRDTFDRLEAGGYDTSGLEFSDQIKFLSDNDRMLDFHLFQMAKTVGMNALIDIFGHQLHKIRRLPL